MTESAQVAKEFIAPEELVRESFALARKVFDSGYRPDLLLAVWRGGTPIGIAVHEFFVYKGIDIAHTVVKAASYRGIGSRGEPEVEHIDAVLAGLRPGANVLVVDDIFDTGSTLKKLSDMLFEKTPNVKTAVIYYKPGCNRTDIAPDYHMRETTAWVVFPHELADLSLDEIRQKDEFIHGLLTQANRGVAGGS